MHDVPFVRLFSYFYRSSLESYADTEYAKYVTPCIIFTLARHVRYTERCTHTANGRGDQRERHQNFALQEHHDSPARGVVRS